MAKKRLEQCKSGKDFIKYASKAGADISNGGRHIKIKTSHGTTFVPVHGNQDLGKGLNRAIKKQFALIGILLLLVLCSGLYFVEQIINVGMIIP